jgi:hypothetical protein
MIRAKHYSAFAKTLILAGCYLSGLRRVITRPSAGTGCRDAWIDNDSSETEWEADLTLTAVLGSVLLAIFLVFGR